MEITYIFLQITTFAVEQNHINSFDTKTILRARQQHTYLVLVKIIYKVDEQYVFKQLVLSDYNIKQRNVLCCVLI